MKKFSLLIPLMFLASLLFSQTCDVKLEQSTPTTCHGGSDGLLRVLGSGIGGSVSYKWNTGATTREIKNLKSGFYAVTVSCFYGTTKGTYYVAQPNSIGTGYITSHVSCKGGNNGSLSHTVTTGGNGGPYSYLWSNGAKTASISGLKAGKYDLTITDPKGCSDNFSYTITEPTSVKLSLDYRDHITCNGANDGRIKVKTSGGVSPYTYKWSNGGTSSLISNLKKGTYNVVVTDKNGCTKSANYSITEPSQVAYKNLSITHVDCNGNKSGAISLDGDGGTPSYSYYWAGGSTTKSINNLSAGNYKLTITDRNKCNEYFSFDVNQPTSLAVKDISMKDNDCFGDQKGEIEVDGQGGTSPYSFSWSNGEKTAKIENLAAGKYDVEITDKNGCKEYKTYTIKEPTELVLTQISISHNLCFSEEKGALEVDGQGGTAPYSFAWSNGAKTAKITDLKADKYDVEITDKNGCKEYKTYTIDEPTELVLIEEAISHNPCFGETMGSITVSGQGGVGPYEYAWSNGGKQSKISGLKAGMYTVDMTDKNGCKTSESFEITEPNELIFGTATVENNSCFGDSKGSIDPAIIGGTSPYIYRWSHGPKTKKIGNLKAGTYELEVEDDKGCKILKSYKVEEPDILSENVIQLRNNGCGETEQGMISIEAIGGTAPYDYKWSNGESGSVISKLTAGKYSVVITDNNGCQHGNSYTISKREELQIDTLVKEDISCFGENNGSIDVEINNGQSPYSFDWSNGDTTSKIEDLTPGEYRLYVIDGAGCERYDTFEIKEPSKMQIDLVEQVDVSCHGDKNGYLEVEGMGGTAPYSYAWDQGSKTNVISDLPGGTYKVVITVKNGCEEKGTYILDDPEKLEYQVDAIEKDNGSKSGSIMITPEGGRPSYTFLWQGPNGFSSSDEDIMGLEAGIYRCNIWDDNKCELETEEIEVEKQTTAIVDRNDRQAQIYPIPARNQLNVANANWATMLQIIDHSGRTIASKQMTSGQSSDILTIDITNLRPGAYQAILIGEDRTEVHILVKQ